MARVGTFREEDQLSVRNGLQAVDGLLPKIKRHTIRIIATIAIHIGSKNPVLHGIDHGPAHSRARVVQVRDIRPVGPRRNDNRAR